MHIANLLGRSTLIGRAPDEILLQHYLAAAREGKGRAALLRAPAGMGKSRLMHEIAQRAGSVGFRSFIGRAFQLEAEFPYAIITDAFQPYVRANAGHAARLAEGIPELTRLFPGIGPQGPGAGSKLALFEGFLTFLSRMASEQPLLVMLDDIHWADPASLELIHYIARHLAGLPVLLLMACRSEEHAESSSASEVVGSLARTGHLSVITLGPLAESDLAEMIRQLLQMDHPPSHDLVAQLVQETGGNPFYLEETLKAMVQERLLVEHEGAWRLRPVGHMIVPSSIREAILSRLTKLSTEERRLLDVAAVFGAPIPLATLRVLVDVDELDLLDLLDHLLTMQILEENVTLEGPVYHFTHPKIQQTIYSEMSAARLQTLHGYTASRLEAFYEAGADTHADELALHFGLSGQPEHLARSIAYDIQAGDRAASLFAFDRAASLYLRALLHDEQAGRVLAAEKLFELLDKLGTVYEKIGDFTAAAEFWDQALSLDNHKVDPMRVSLLYRNLARVHWEHGDGARALRYCDQGLAVLAESGLDGPITAALHHERFEVLLRNGGASEAAEALNQVTKAASRSGQAKALAICTGDWATLALWTGNVAGAVREGLEALAALQEDAGTQVAQLSLHLTLAWALWGMGRRDDGKTHAEMALSLTQRFGLVALQGSPLLILALMELEIGNWHSASALAREAVAAQRAHKSPSLGLHLAVLALVDALQGNWVESSRNAAEAEALAERFYRDAPSLEGMMAHCLLGRYHLVCTDLVGATRHYAITMDLVERLGYSFMLVAPEVGFIHLPELLAIQKESKAAWLWLRRIEAQRMRMGGEQGVPWLLLAEALLYAREDRAGQAKASLEKAITKGKVMNNPWAVQRAHQLAVDLNLDVDGTEMPKLAIPKRPDGLTRRELEVIREVCRHKTDKEIAATLHLSVRTVSTHLTRIYTKLNLHSRTQLVAYGLQHGLVLPD